MELTDNEHIHRVELARGAAWEVKARHGSSKKTQVFIDKLFGGTEPALQAARAWRDETLKAMRGRAAKPPKPVLRRRTPPEKPLPRTRSAAPSGSTLEDARQEIKKGAYRSRPRVEEIKRHESLMPSIDGGPPRIDAFWTARWTDAGGSSQTRKFSVNYWGEEVARQKAMEAHEQQLRWIQAIKAQDKAKSLGPTTKENKSQPAPAPTNEAPMLCIQRLDTRHRGTWKVQIKRAKERKHKYFPDSGYGGKDAALAAAKAWRDQTLAEMDGPDYQVWKRDHPLATNTTGMPGVYRGVAGSKQGGKVVETPYWEGNWTDLHGKRRRRVFSIKAYGEEGAKALAMQARRQGLEEVARVAASRQTTTRRSKTVPTPKSRRATSPAV